MKQLDAEKVQQVLDRLADALESKRARINSWDNYSKDTFLAFDSYNLGLTTAIEMLGSCVAEITDMEPVNEMEALPR